MMRVVEIFHSLQGEGYYTGVAAIFVRLSGCNLMCDFCDTDHSRYVEMTVEEILRRVSVYDCCHVVITGGEPTLQITRELIDGLHAINRYVQIETNGSIALEPDVVDAIDWITCSPKGLNLPVIGRIDELKVVYDYRNAEMIERYDGVDAKCRYLQPCDRNNEDYNRLNLKVCIDYIMRHPQWRLSLQTHKLIGIQ